MPEKHKIPRISLTFRGPATSLHAKLIDGMNEFLSTGTTTFLLSALHEAKYSKCALHHHKISTDEDVNSKRMILQFSEDHSNITITVHVKKKFNQRLIFSYRDQTFDSPYYQQISETIKSIVAQYQAL